MTSKSEFIEWNKGKGGKINEFFSYQEFECRCSRSECKTQKISIELIDRLTSIRKEINQPLLVTSAYRCAAHQNHIRNSGISTVVAQTTSQHELGKAADILPIDRKDIKSKFLDIVSKYFKSIGLSNNFLHVDLRDDKERRWDY